MGFFSTKQKERKLYKARLRLQDAWDDSPDEVHNRCWYIADKQNRRFITHKNRDRGERHWGTKNYLGVRCPVCKLYFGQNTPNF